jgi:xanthosine utilization system XapX-like protein
MNLSLSVYRRMLFIHAAIFAAVALVLTIGVIEPVKVEASIGATKAIAVKAFWVNIGLNFLSAVVLVLIAIRFKSQIWNATPVHAVVGIVAILLGLSLVDAASAYQTHGPSMQTASTLLFFCAAADFLAGVLLVMTAFFQPKNV